MLYGKLNRLFIRVSSQASSPITHPKRFDACLPALAFYSDLAKRPIFVTTKKPGLATNHPSMEQTNCDGCSELTIVNLNLHSNTNGDVMLTDSISIPHQIWQMKLKPLELTCYMVHLLLAQKPPAPLAVIVKASSLFSPRQWSQANRKLFELNMIKLGHRATSKIIVTDVSEWKGITTHE